VVGIALASALFWTLVDASVAVKAFTSVLIVACPCALALAAPLTLGTGQRWLAARNVFLRNAQLIERMSGVDTIVLDKTGTLTSPGAGTVNWLGLPLTKDEERWLYSMTRHSAHPLAVKIAELMRGASAESVQSFVETSGCGLEGRVGAREILMGSAAWLESRGTRRGSKTQPRNVADGQTAAAGASHTNALRGSAVHVAIDGCMRGCFVLESALRPEVGALIERLRGHYQLVLLSGDNARDAQRFTSLFGGKARVEFNQSPFDKLSVIRELQTAGRTVMMVGDGLNDAGALKQADVGMAVVDRVGTFSPASDVILDATQLPRLAEVLAFSRRAARVVRTGFVVSGLYNLVGISIAAAGLLSPLVCAVLMPLSSVTVVLFAIGATRWMARRTFNEVSRKHGKAPASHSRNGSLPASAAMEEAVP
jgi:Cu+-exporting ATPase